jgi:uncharacterized protein (DUF58 family)
MGDGGSRLLPEEARTALGGLQFRPRIAAEGRVSGVHASSHLGQSLEFSDLKGYAFGDDPRGIDWKVFARTDKLYVRRYLDETNLTAHLVLDGSGSMASPLTGGKYQHAASILAGLAYVLLRQGDEVGVTVASALRPRSCAARSVPSHLTEILGVLSEARPAGGTVLLPAMQEVLGRARRKGVVVLASDLLTDFVPVVDTLGMLASRGHAVMLLHVLSQDERTFPFQGTVVFRSEETGETALLDARALRRKYLQAIEAFTTSVRGACHDARVFYCPVPMLRTPHVEVAEVIRSVEVGRRRRVP